MIQPTMSLYLTDSCGTDTICQSVQPCYFPIAHFGYQNNESTGIFMIVVYQVKTHPGNGLLVMEEKF